MCRRVTPNRHVTAFLSLCQFREFDALLQQRIRRVFKLLFDPCDLSVQPAGKSFFQLKLRAAPRDMRIASQNAVWVAMIVVTWFRDLDHKCAGPLESERFHVITVTLSGARLPWVEVRGRQ
jgi:hypothetical protein